MINPEALTEGMTVQKNGALYPDREIYRLERAVEESLENRWFVKRVSDSSAAVLTAADLCENYSAIPVKPYAELDVRPLVGRLVVLKLSTGNMKGVVRAIEYAALTALDVDLKLPVALLLDTDRVELKDIKAIEAR